MTSFLRELGLIAVLGCCSSCGEHSVDLDQAAPQLTSAGASGTGAVQSLDLRHFIDKFLVDDGRVFAQIESTRAESCVFEQCASTQIDLGLPVAHSLAAVDADDVYFDQWLTHGLSGAIELLRCPPSGCKSGAVKVFEDEFDSNPGWPIAMDEKYVYWSSIFDLLRCPLTGCKEVPELVAKGEGGVAQIDLSSDRVYYVGFDQVLRAAAVRSVPKDGSAPPTALARVGTVGAASGVRVDAMNAYWLDVETQHIQSCPLTGCGGSPTTLVATDTPKDSLKVDAAGLYWIDGTGQAQSVRFCPLAGCRAGTQPVPLVPAAVRQYELDSNYVYWTETGDANELDVFNTVHRVAKPKPAN